MNPWLDDGDVRLYHGDSLETVRELPSDSVDCVVTSPPYWGLRCYGVDGQMGLEETPDLFVAGMVELFREIRRVLAPHGTCWVNLGDTYAAARSYQVRDNKHTEVGNNMSSEVPEGLKPKDLVGIPWRVAFALQADGWWLRSDIIWSKPNPMPESVTDRPTKAHEYVFLLTKQPRYYFDTEAVREPHSPDGRKQTAHIHATDNSHPNYDNIGNGNERWPNGGRNVRSVWQIATQPYPEAHFATYPEELARRCILAGCPTRVCRVCGKPSERIVDVYDGNGRKTQTRRKPQPLGAWLRQKRLDAGLTMTQVTAVIGAHGAVNHGGAMSNWEADKNVPTAEQWAQLKPLLNLGDDKDELLAQWHQWERGEWGTTPDALTHGAPSAGPARTTTVETTGWTDCGCNDESGEPLPSTTNTYEGGWRPGVVLDPFIGSGTTAKVARDHQRHAIGIDLNETYLELAARRLQQLSLLNAP